MSQNRLRTEQSSRVSVAHLHTSSTAPRSTQQSSTETMPTNPVTDPKSEVLSATLPVGAHLITPRFGFVHHGIYVGDGRVIHYAGLSRGWRLGPIQEVSLERFAGGRGVATKAWIATAFDAQTIVARARSRLGENHYRMWSNNCEHFCEWCISDTSRSSQVDVWRSRANRVLSLLGSWWLAARGDGVPLRVHAKRSSDLRTCAGGNA